MLNTTKPNLPKMHSTDLLLREPGNYVMEIIRYFRRETYAKYNAIYANVAVLARPMAVQERGKAPSVIWDESVRGRKVRRVFVIDYGSDSLFQQLCKALGENPKFDRSNDRLLSETIGFRPFAARCEWLKRPGEPMMGLDRIRALTEAELDSAPDWMLRRPVVMESLCAPDPRNIRTS